MEIPCLHEAFRQGVTCLPTRQVRGKKTFELKAQDNHCTSGNQRLNSISLNNIGENFLAPNDLEKCREYTLKAIDINKQLKAWRGVAINYELLQQCDLRENKYEKTYQNLLTGMPYAFKGNTTYVISLYYIGIGKYKASVGELDSTKYYFDKALAEANITNELRNKCQVYIARVEYVKNITIDQKISLLHQAFDIATQTGYKEGMAYRLNYFLAFMNEWAIRIPPCTISGYIML